MQICIRQTLKKVDYVYKTCLEHVSYFKCVDKWKRTRNSYFKIEKELV